jgi:hypothetical protein
MSDQPNLLTLEERPEDTVEGLLRLASETSTAIFEAEKESLESSAWIRDQRWRLEKLEAQITVKVSAAKVDPEDPESKYLFTNADSRKAEVSRRLSEDPAYKELMAALLVAETEQQVRRLTIERLAREFQTLKLGIGWYTALRQNDPEKKGSQ